MDAEVFDCVIGVKTTRQGAGGFHPFFYWDGIHPRAGDSDLALLADWEGALELHAYVNEEPVHSRCWETG